MDTKYNGSELMKHESGESVEVVIFQRPVPSPLIELLRPAGF